MLTRTTRISCPRPVRRVFFLLVCIATFLMVGRISARASVAVYVGKNLTKDGSVLLAGYGDEPSSHWLEIAPRRKHPLGSTITLGSTAESTFPGRLIKIPQTAETFKTSPWITPISEDFQLRLRTVE